MVTKSEAGVSEDILNSFSRVLRYAGAGFRMENTKPVLHSAVLESRGCGVLRGTHPQLSAIRAFNLLPLLRASITFSPSVSSDGENTGKT
jgi:hypothetical protein